MIKNDRQYQLTKTQLRGFEDSLRELGSAEQPLGTDPLLLEVQRRALESQRDELRSEVEQYESLRQGKISTLVIEDFAQLPTALIKARIAQRLTQKELAQRLGVKEQQVQRWEANDYAGASIETLKSVIKALGVATREELFVPSSGLTMETFVQNLGKIGIPKNLLLRRILPAPLAAKFEKNRVIDTPLEDLIAGAGRVCRVFGMHVSDLMTLTRPALPLEAVAAARFKLPARVKPNNVNAYTVYAHYLAGVLESCTIPTSTGALPSDYHHVHSLLTSPDEPITLTKTLTLLWKLGVPVLPLRDVGMFHGAVWEIRNRFVIVLKQTTGLESRWLYDLLHEWGHLASGHLREDSTLLEPEPIEPGTNQTEEIEANEWAEDALFDGDSAEIEQACTQACDGKLQRLKTVLPGVARTDGNQPRLKELGITYHQHAVLQIDIL
jgi:transcriptional regulator with XRE-family HTH domain